MKDAAVVAPIKGGIERRRHRRVRPRPPGRGRASSVKQHSHDLEVLGRIISSPGMPDHSAIGVSTSPGQSATAHAAGVALSVQRVREVDHGGLRVCWPFSNAPCAQILVARETLHPARRDPTRIEPLTLVVMERCFGDFKACRQCAQRSLRLPPALGVVTTR
jgi:hypothetical protein